MTQSRRSFVRTAAAAAAGFAAAEPLSAIRPEREIGIAARMSPNDSAVITNVKMIRDREFPRVKPSDYTAELKELGSSLE